MVMISSIIVHNNQIGYRVVLRQYDVTFCIIFQVVRLLFRAFVTLYKGLFSIGQHCISSRRKSGPVNHLLSELSSGFFVHFVASSAAFILVNILCHSVNKLTSKISPILNATYCRYLPWVGPKESLRNCYWVLVAHIFCQSDSLYCCLKFQPQNGKHFLRSYSSFRTNQYTSSIWMCLKT